MTPLALRHLFAVPLLAFAASPAPAQSLSSPSPVARVTKLNGPLSEIESDLAVQQYQVTPDGTRVVFLAPPFSHTQLYSAPADGSAPPVRLNQQLAADGEVERFALAPAAGRVVYTASFHLNGDELFSVPIDHSARAVRLSAPLGPGEQVHEFWLSPDDRYAFFSAGTFTTRSLYRAPIDGRTPAVLFLSTTPKDLWFTPDGSTVVYPVVVGSQTDLFQVPADGSAAPAFVVRSRQPTPDHPSSLAGPTFSDDGRRFLVHDVLLDGGLWSANDLLTATLDGSYAPHTLNQGSFGSWRFDGDDRLVLLEDGHLVSLSLAHGDRVVLDPPGASNFSVLDSDGATFVFAAVGFDVCDLFEVPMDGSQPAVQLIRNTSMPINFAKIVGSRVVFTSYAGPYGTYIDTVSRLGGGQRVRLTPAFQSPSRITVHPDGVDLVYLTGGRAYTVPIDGSTPQRSLAVGVEGYFLKGAGNDLVYQDDGSFPFDLFTVPFAGGIPLSLNGPLAVSSQLGDVFSMKVTPDEERVVYRADQDADGLNGAYVARVDGSAPPFSLTNGLPPAQNIFAGLALTPDGARAVFVQAGAAGSTTGALYVADATQPAPPLLLDARSGIDQQELLVAPGGERIVYRRKPSTRFELCSARLDGGGSALTLTPTLGTVTGLQFTPDGAEVLYLADQDTGSVLELYRVPLDGSAPPVKLNPPLSGGSDVFTFAIAPDGGTVVYVADARVDQRFELHAVPTHGTVPPSGSRHLGKNRALNGPLVTGGDVSDFVITPDGTSVIYRADQRSDQHQELYRVPITGGEPILLTPVGTDPGVQAGYVVSADGLTVYYRSMHTGSGIELYRVAADGSSSPVRLSGTLTSGGNVVSFALAPDQTHLVYCADQRVDQVMELFDVNAQPGTDVLLHSLPLDADTRTLRIAPDSSAAVYSVNRLGTIQLFRAPLDGSSRPVLMNHPLPNSGAVSDDFVPLSSGRVVYRANQEDLQTVQLYHSVLDDAGSASPGGIR